MERIVLRHLSGSKANQVEEFPLNLFKELVIGRDTTATVRYDPDRDDLVGRQHARIQLDPADPTQFLITDLNSRNGTYVNKQRIAGTTRVMPGDLVQFGPGGPEFQFDVEPRPQSAVKPTRIGTEPNQMSTVANPIPATRTGPSPYPPAPGNIPPTSAPGGFPPHPQAGAPPAGYPPTGPGAYPSAPGAAPGTVGKATVERMIAQSKSQSRIFMVLGGLVILLIVVGVAGFLVYQKMESEKKVSGALTEAKSETGKLASDLSNLKAGAPMSAAEITNNFGKAVVYIECGWKLIYTPNGGQVYHRYIPNVVNGRPIVPDGRPFVACYVAVGDTVEPVLTLDARQGKPIGGEHTGSGFAVTNDGFILTNRHVAATFRTSYQFPADATPGIVIQNGSVMASPDGSPLLVQAPGNWVPSETKQAGQQLQGGFEGRNDYLNVTFPNNETRVPAKIARVSDRHDVAMVKIDLPETVTKVDLFDNYDDIKPGDVITVLGYPAVSPPVYGVVRSQDVFNRESKMKIVPSPTVSGGNIGRILRGQDSANSTKDPIYSLFGDAYQLTVNSTGSGNSGGPVFDDHGRVVGIFYASNRADAMVTFAVPIRYGKELMGVK